jgi:MFS superfamily sulfate permease-like transporter
MSNSRKAFCTLSILLSFLAIYLIWRYSDLGKQYPAAIIVAMIAGIGLNIFIFSPKKGNH